ncbi:MAG TPA: hypothetical protein PLM15_00705, partial [Methanothrix soehngenii]|nr:hypothetical protein [Methanothrix soehngenii]
PTLAAQVIVPIYAEHKDIHGLLFEKIVLKGFCACCHRIKAILFSILLQFIGLEPPGPPQTEKRKDPAMSKKYLF